MVIRTKNTNRRVITTPTVTQETPPEVSSTQGTKPKTDVNELHQPQVQHPFSPRKGEITLSQPGFHFVNQNISNLLEEQSAQRKEAKVLKENLALTKGAVSQSSDSQQWQSLQAKMALTQQKLQKMRRKEKWLKAGLMSQKQMQMGQKWLDNAENIQQMSQGPLRQLAHLDNQVNMIQNTQGITGAGTRLSIIEAGALNRHELGQWLSNKMPSHLLSKSVVSILTQQPTTEAIGQSPTEQWLEQGNGGSNLSRLNNLSQYSAIKDRS